MMNQAHPTSRASEPLYMAGPSCSVDNPAKQSENEMIGPLFFKVVIATLVRWSYFKIIWVFRRN